jgi:hypothetical protein
MYIKLTGDNPEIYTLRQLRKDNPNVSFPVEPPLETLEQYGVWPYVKAPIPSYEPATQTYDELPMAATNGVYSEVYVVRDKTQAELDDDAAKVAERNRRRISRVQEEFYESSSIAKVLLKIAFLQEKELRTLNGKPQITAEQFREWVINQVD